MPVRQGWLFPITSQSQEAMQFPLALAVRKLKAICWLPLSKEHTLWYVCILCSKYTLDFTLFVFCFLLNLIAPFYLNVHILIGRIKFFLEQGQFIFMCICTYVSTNTYIWIYIHIYMYYILTNDHYEYKNLCSAIKKDYFHVQILTRYTPVASIPPICGKCLLFLEH